ncbi:MFS transporter [Streptomyces sp. MBT67]|uniref:MFS transporter n=1 Tax=unclassified Streptomyces TaxID=2593676 RepID=UPI00190C4893|nr:MULTISPECIES: MFS transporter [unclassified Streptomyces]MBK3530773.1 MFS transporter [Streptomyces sp. MBT72]MBK3536325.1 MFS transporter [Streptomyces sp. MBT67]MBK3554147.1 MFS transporter [Streptomyces sp. MBT61]MBK6033234.1 MFS transporter [Streptomyces sp. MBT59]
MGVGSAVVRVLRDRTAGRCLAGVVVSGFGTSALWLTAGIWVKSLTGSNTLAALTVFAMWAPVLAGPALGALADRMDRKVLLVRGNLVTACLLVPLVLVDSGRTVWLLFAVLVLHGASGVVLDAAESALVAGTVPASLLADFNGLRMTANEGMKLVAPLAGAGLYVRFGGPAVALLAAVTCALAALVFARLPVRRTPATADSAPAGSWRDELAAGLRRIRASAVLRPLVTAGAATMFLAGVNGAVTFAYVDEVLGRAPAYAGVLYAVQGAGSVAVGLLAGPLLRRLPERVFAAGGIAVFALGVGARTVSPDAVALAASAAIGFGLPCVLIAAMTAVQRETPDAVLGRTAATAGSLMTAPNAVALALGAGLVAVVDVRVLTAAAGAAGVLAAMVLAAGARRGRDATASPRA